MNLYGLRFGACGICVTGLLAAALVLPSAEPSQAQTAAGCKYPGGNPCQFRSLRSPQSQDRFINYDVRCTGDGCSNGNNVDWPVNLLFWNDAFIQEVRDGLSPWFAYEGSGMHMKLNNGGGFDWWTDNGIKTVLCPTNNTDNARHMRLYVHPGKSRMYSPNWGFYVLGTSHIDAHECGALGDQALAAAWFGESENAEGYIAARARIAWPGKVAEDVVNFRNFEEPRNESDGTHRWKNNGLGTRVKLPSPPP